ncbi:MAG: iron ABC transporter permease [Pseudomonadota bacterium]
MKAIEFPKSLEKLMLPKMNVEKTIMLSTTILVCIMILYPLSTLVYNSFTFQEWGKPVVYTLDNYKKIFTTGRYFTAFKNSIIISLGVAFFAGIIGLALAWITARTNTPLRVKLEPLNMIPYFLSALVGAISWSYIISPKIGFLNVFLMDTFNLSGPPFNIYSIGGIIWVEAVHFIPFVYLFMCGLFQKMDPALEESARVSGASMFQTIKTVTLPLALPGILYSLSILFIITLGSFAVPAMLGLPVNITVIGTQMREVINRYPSDYSLASAMGMITLIMCIVVIIIQRKVILPREFVTVTGKGYRPSLIDLGKWKYATLSFNLAYLLIGVIIPLGVLVMVSLHKLWRGWFDFHSLTFGNYTFILTQYSTAKNAIWNSLILGTFGATVGMILCVIVVFILVRTKVKGRIVLDFVTSLAIGIPGIILAMGILLAYIKTPLYGTLWIMGLAYITHFLPIGMRNANAMFLAISPELEESSRTCGSSWLSTLKNISIPLMKSGLVGGWLILFLIFVKEINSSILLFSSGNEVMAIVLFQLLEEYTPPVVASYAVILTGILLLAVFIVKRIVGLEKIK